MVFNSKLDEVHDIVVVSDSFTIYFIVVFILL
jgi:hypothetical protein